jgi:hypothetical protein
MQLQLILVQKNFSVRIVKGEVFTMSSANLSNSVAFPEEKVFSEEELANGITEAYINACSKNKISVIVRVPHPMPATTESWYGWPDEMINAAVDLKGIFPLNDNGKTQAIKCINKIAEQHRVSLERQKTSISAAAHNAIQAILNDAVSA